MVPISEIRKQVWTDEEEAQSQWEAGLLPKPRYLTNPRLYWERSQLHFTNSVFHLPCLRVGWALPIDWTPHPYTSCTLQLDSKRWGRGPNTGYPPSHPSNQPAYRYLEVPVPVTRDSKVN